MPVKIRLARHGKKDYAFYHIVAADSRAPRDGKFIERLGSYNPNTDPAAVELNFDAALRWLEVGAQPTDTCRNILSQEGVLLMKHLKGGVKKGAFSEAEMQARFDKWKNERDAKLQSKQNAKTEKSNNVRRERKAAEEAKRAQIEKRIADKLAALAAEAQSADAEGENASESAEA